jgi:hypothetical protein
LEINLFIVFTTANDSKSFPPGSFAVGASVAFWHANPLQNEPK